MKYPLYRGTQGRLVVRGQCQNCFNRFYTDFGLSQAKKKGCRKCGHPADKNVFRSKN